MKLQNAFTVLVASFTITPAAWAQGMTEYGSLLGAQGKPSGALNNAVNQTYNQAANAINGVNGQSGISGISHQQPAMDASDQAMYGKQANQYYLAAQKSLKLGNQNDAIKQYSNALVIRQRIWGDTDPAVPQLLLQQADLYRKQGDLHSCENNYRKILSINIKRYGTGTKELDPTLSCLADLCERQCNTVDALNYYQQLAAIRQRFDPPDSEPVKSAKLKLASTLTATSHYPNAEKILTEAIAGEDASQKPDNVYLCKLLDIYGGLLRETSREDEATKIEARQHDLAAQLAPARDSAAKTAPVASAVAPTVGHPSTGSSSTTPAGTSPAAPQATNSAVQTHK